MIPTKVPTNESGVSPLHEMQQSPVVVLGASGMVGRFLVDRLVGAGVDTIAISRSAQAPRPHVKWITADFTSLKLSADAPVRVAFNAGPIWELPAALPALRQAGMRRLVAISSTSRFTKTNSPIKSEREVVGWLIEGETTTQAYCEEHGIAWTILRPTVIYAEGQDRSITRLANLIRRFRMLPVAGDALGRRQPVHADDLAAGAIAAAASAAAENRSYNLPGGETLSYRAMCERIFEGLGYRPRIISVPPPIWRLGLSGASLLMPGITSAMGSRMSEDLTFDPSEAERDFGWNPRRFRPHFKSAE
jgi:nucleoside-diphosphate-sugar epimerase